MVLKAENLSLSLSGGEKEVFSDISLELNEGEMCIADGRSGSGKTMLGLTLCGFLPLWAGNWKLAGRIELLGKPLIQGEYFNEIGLVLQNPYTQVSGIKSSVMEELAFPLECRGINPGKMPGLVNRCAEALGIAHLLNRKVKNLSGGELQRAIIACTLVSGPRFMFLDRFMTEIDNDFRPQLFKIIDSHLKEFEGAALIAEDPWLLPDNDFNSRIHLGTKEDTPYIPEELSAETSYTARAAAGREMLNVESVSFSYFDENPVLDNISFSLGSGELLFLKGANGAGKTTLAKLIAGIIKPSSGKIIIDSRPIGSLKQHEIMSLVGLAFQNPGLHICRKTAREELELAELWGNSPGELVGILGLDNLLDNHPLELSQAEKKRLGMALTHGERRKLVILDEPSQYQDSRGFAMIAEAVRHITGEGKAVLIISHDPRFDHVFPGAPSIRLFPGDSY